MKTTFRTIHVTAFLAVFSLLATFARADEPAADAPRLERLVQELNLTEEQKAAIGPILRRQAEEFRALQADTSLRRMQKLRRAKEINEKASRAIRAQLDPEQQKKYEELRAELRKEMKARAKERKAQQGAGG